jgi:ABC-type lipoprotein export system ATPase subunit
MTALVAASGSGKSTLMNIMAGLAASSSGPRSRAHWLAGPP